MTRKRYKKMLEFKEYNEKMDSLCEMSHPRKHVIYKLFDASDNVIIHLMTIYLYPNDININHWKSEVYSSLHKTFRLKSNNKYLPYKDILETLLGWEDCFYDHFESYIDDVMIKEHKRVKPKCDNKEKLLNFLHNYFVWLAREFAKNGDVTMKQVSQKIDELRGKQDAKLKSKI